MPTLTYPIDPNGLLVPVLVGLDGQSTSLVVQAGLRVPAPLHGIGTIDTGTDTTCLSSRFIQHFRLPIKHKTTTTTVAGVIAVDLFSASLSIAPADGSPSPLFVHPDLLVMELAQSLPANISVVIGLDVLKKCDFHLAGPAGWFSLTF